MIMRSPDCTEVRPEPEGSHYNGLGGHKTRPYEFILWARERG